jgi:preprotein translocase subunit SecG
MLCYNSADTEKPEIAGEMRIVPLSASGAAWAAMRREVNTMDVLKIVLIVLEVIASLALILVVLLQSGKEAGLSGAISGNADTYMGKNKTSSLDKMLASSTKWIALAWILLALGLTIVSVL